MSYPPSAIRRPQDASNAQLRPRATRPSSSPRSGRSSYLATGGTTDGDFGLYRYVMAGPPAGPAAHFHRTVSESFFVLSGTVRLFDGRVGPTRRPATSCTCRVGGVHAFRNESGERAEMLLLFTPGRRARRTSRSSPSRAGERRPFTDEEREELYRRHDQFMV